MFRYPESPAVGQPRAPVALHRIIAHHPRRATPDPPFVTDLREDARLAEDGIGAAGLRPQGARAGFLASRFGWALASFGGTFAIKLALNMALTRLLVPEVFGIMVVVNALRVGIELLTDVGIEQNIVRNDRGLEPDFFNTAWTLQILRGALLSLLFLALAPLAGHFYAIDPRVFMLISAAPLLNALHSTSIFAAVKRLEVKQRNLFEFAAEAVNLAACCLFAWLSPTIWSLLAGVLVGIAARSAMSYALPHPAHRLLLRREHVATILRFGSWIAVASLLTYAAGNIDRLMLGKLAPLGLLGIFGLARTVAELPVTLAGRLGYQVMFPYLAGDRADGARALARVRLALVLAVAAGMASVAAWSDWAVAILYDDRYRLAGPMLGGLVIGAWFGVLATLNEALVLGAGRPAYLSGAGIVRVGWLVVALPLGWGMASFPGVIVAIWVGEIARYAVIALGQARAGAGFARQDLLGTLAFAVVLGGWIGCRHLAGIGQAWSGLFAGGIA
jgi:O-antigen/teichoic acid export membrane protein